MNRKLIKTAKDYQGLDRQIKILQAKMKPLKAELLKYAQENKADFDEAFQLKFENGTYISHRVKDIVEGTKSQKAILMGYQLEFVKRDLDEAKVIEEAPKNAKLRKFLTKNNLKITQKETFAIYAG
ncbi:MULTISPECIES: hypothetical protein [Tenacibaculum]|uniref:hypothetical protein n=1 Tax=Tenacibaculum TaxID=104267 RepID=UPI000C4988F8|nr:MULTISPECIES: hypothetical protein [Tenacibaculum]MCD8428850.1 hypothetical protein [Tenacibaculum finnmarkense genomovar ulcerans]SOS56055.1 conserved hypothetical protein [Tenacibaculum finnmarkense]